MPDIALGTKKDCPFIMTPRNEQERFWSESYAEAYIAKNNAFDSSLGERAWHTMLSGTDTIGSILECGSNIGRNIRVLDALLPSASKSIIEVSKPAYDFVTTQHKLALSFNGTILESNFGSRSFDLVFTMGVLIHLNPDSLIQNMEKLYEYSSRYILIGEYFNRTPVMIEYQGEKNRLFKQDFGRTFIDSFDVKLVNYGFLWDYVYGPAGFDDITYWLFEKR